MKKCSASLALLCLLQPLVANANELWEYVDAEGNAFYAHEQVTPQYRLFSNAAQDSVGQVAVESEPLGALLTHDDLALSVKLDDVLQEQPKSEPVALTPRMQPRVKATYKGILYVNKAKKYAPLRKQLRAAAKKHKVDYELLISMVAAESGFDKQAVSHRGAVGLMQILPSTAKHLGVKATKDKTVAQRLLDPQTNVMTGAKYLSYLMRMFKNRPELAVAAYNAGEGTVQRSGNAIPRYRETQKYVRKVLTMYSALKPAAGIGNVNQLVVQSTKGYKSKNGSSSRALAVKNSTTKKSARTVASNSGKGKSQSRKASGQHNRMNLGGTAPKLVVTN